MTRSSWLCTAAIAFTGWMADPAHAIDIETIDVRYENGFYKVRLVAELEAQPQSVARVLTDYAQYPALDPRIEESHLIASPAGEPPRLYTKLKGCVGSIFCRSMVRVETLNETPGELFGTAIPELSDVRKSVTHTQWQAGSKGTHVTYTLTLDPKFWVPAFFARRAMIETMRSGTVAMFTSVERVARELPVSSDGN
jgi:hypothetical protein